MRLITLLLCGLIACGDKDDTGSEVIEETPEDADGDGVVSELDCDDNDSAAYPGATELCDEADNDCDGEIDEGYDVDADGWTTCAGDCDDDDASVRPEVTESCDGVDNNCDGQIDEDLGGLWYTDIDGDGYGSDSTATETCDPEKGAVSVGGDCDDGDSGVYPGQEDSCDGEDSDCDCDVDEDATFSTAYVDADEDGFGSEDKPLEHCGEVPSGYVDNSEDCDDSTRMNNPSAPELCDGEDNDCDGQADNDALNANDWYADTDGDGFGDIDSRQESCDTLSGYVLNALDCDDSTSDISPDVAEECGDELDNNCDGNIDENMGAWWPDIDGDGYGDDSVAVTESCDQPTDYVANRQDCDDDEITTYLGAEEVCDDGVDNNCSGVVDEDLVDWYPDEDGDGFGDEDATPTSACEEPSGYVSIAGDCDDESDATNPLAEEDCEDEIDNDCDDEVDEGYCYESWNGFETLDYSGGGLSGARNCELYWDTTSTSPVTSLSASCDNCEFMFEVDYSYDSSASSDDGTCAGYGLTGDKTGTYGYSSSFDSYGTSWVYEYYGSYIWWGYGSLSSDTFTYTYGYEDYPYSGTYYTYYQYGQATMK